MNKDKINIWAERAVTSRQGLVDALAIITQVDLMVATRDELEEILEEVVNSIEETLSELD